MSSLVSIRSFRRLAPLRGNDRASAVALEPPPPMPPGPAISATANRRRRPRSPAGISTCAASDGVGLPDGKGTVDHGADVLRQHCAACHGTFGEGEGRYPKLMGGEGTLTGDRPEPSVGSYWPFAPTLFDYINRAMPFSAPHTLSADDVYAVIAYILNFNNIVPSDFVADRDSLPKVKMPNRDNFTWKDPRPDTAAKRLHEELRRSESCENHLDRPKART